MRYASAAPVPQRWSHPVEQRHPWLHALDLFEVPFFAYAPDGRRIDMSTTARRLVNEPAWNTISHQADQFASAELARKSACLHLGHVALVRELPSCSGVFTLSLYVARPALSGVGGIVIARGHSESEPDAQELSALTPREREVARLVATGLPTKSIASQLGISSHTARHHIEHVFSKLGVNCRAGVASLVRSQMGRSIKTAPTAGAAHALRDPS